jgi:hypothetical protein
MHEVLDSVKFREFNGQLNDCHFIKKTVLYLVASFVITIIIIIIISSSSSSSSSRWNDYTNVPVPSPLISCFVNPSYCYPYNFSFRSWIEEFRRHPHLPVIYFACGK